MALSKLNKAITIKVSLETYMFITTFSKKYKCSVSSFCQDCITQAILYHDKVSQDPIISGCSTPTGYYQKLAYFINETYDKRRK